MQKDTFGLAVLLVFLAGVSGRINATNLQGKAPERAAQEEIREIKRLHPEYLSICNKTNIPVLHYRFREEQYYLDKAKCNQHPSLNKLNKITFFNPHNRVEYNLVYQRGAIHTFVNTSGWSFDLHTE